MIKELKKTKKLKLLRNKNKHCLIGNSREEENKT